MQLKQGGLQAGGRRTWTSTMVSGLKSCTACRESTLWTWSATLWITSFLAMPALERTSTMTEKVVGAAPFRRSARSRAAASTISSTTARHITCRVCV